MSSRKICRAIPNVQETLEVASNDAELMVQDRGGILEKMITVSIYIIGIWLVYYWYMIGIWLVYDWYIIGIWLVYDWYMIGIWLVYYWYIIGILLVYYWCIIGILLVYYWYIIDIWLYYYYHDMIYIIEIIIIMIIVPLGEYILINRSSS